MTAACRAIGLSRRAFYRAGRARDDDAVIDALQVLVAAHGRWGFWKCFRRLRLDGHGWNHKRVLRVYRQLKLNLPRRTRKRLPRRERQTLAIEALPNRLWSIDFMSDVLYGGRRFRTFNVLDEGVREAQVREITAGWITTYNERRPHESLGDLPPSIFRRAVETAERSTYSVRR